MITVVTQTMVTLQTATLEEANSCHMAPKWNSLVMYRTLWRAPSFCTVTMGHGTEDFLLARVGI